MSTHRRPRVLAWAMCLLLSAIAVSGSVAGCDWGASRYLEQTITLVWEAEVAAAEDSGTTM